ncbi:HD domain-containing phosphohydrolase [Chitinimonas koreensis]|uniref:HD domain-containing phosphohydrolase n=1 Tax=Chitinimonas koreensis TaxID=356302 RepID=UPI0004011343|nr:HD domain-containing phosphohydrolase [Chitinimonas koreensis]QNM96161.1 HD domain-containing protein [Chitinimonas koreensis]
MARPALVEPLLKSLYVMAAMVEARDPYTGGHLWRVSQFSRLLALDLGLPAADVARIALGGFLHDLGKIGVPDAVLNKRDKLDDAEYAVIRTHPEIGMRLLAGHPLARLVEAAVAMHHETPDGRGYPAGLQGEAIPLDARIVGLTDAFDAMTSNRPYRRGMPIERALAIIGENLGSQFDRALGERFIALGGRGALEHIVGHTEPGIPLFECPMCGPTIVVRRGQAAGETVYCRACGNEAEVERSGGTVNVHGTGRMGDARALEPEIDELLIDELSAEAGRYLAVARPPRGPLGWLRGALGGG